jgi:hypothetical protein
MSQSEKPQTYSKKVIYPELSYKITGIFFDIHKELGLFAREKNNTVILLRIN